MSYRLLSANEDGQFFISDQMCPKDVPRLQKPGFELIFSTVSAVYIAFHKVTKIVCILSLAEKLIRMRVCKHGCEVKMT